ncbi:MULTISPECIES: hypothetical protein [Bosea]|uniref:hypothetical protein n=1 Tax=Bosea TaxID=85413 RepID=UPI0021500A7F|nr:MULTISPECIES: hypothetical protein [Bosea]MCR4521685.1 hypothetical protein [Bosea sp. 47.2.35]MDR6831663.1 hypothetical protein [Bosea robiniae]MDR6898372.1 hypothetical protein [Bosea sp. BE109]MDR7141769.1 hypothetical protein [Bosea sp. BE168]MDR7178379.1 hypothetical protein [Bosea sp. BE271]
MEQDEPVLPPITEGEIDAVLQEANGDSREAIRMLLHDLAVLARDADRLVSHGYVRGQHPWRRAS